MENGTIFRKLKGNNMHKTAITSVTCYIDLRNSGAINRNQSYVINFMSDRQDATRREIAEALGGIQVALQV